MFSDYIRFVRGAVWVRHCRTEFKKHVLPKLFRPGPVCADLGHVNLRFDDFESRVETFFCKFGWDAERGLEVADVDGFPCIRCVESI